MRTTFATLAILALASAVDLTTIKGDRPEKADADIDEDFVGGDKGTWSPNPIEADDDIVGDDSDTWTPSDLGDEIVGDDSDTWSPKADDEDRRPKKDDDGAPSDDDEESDDESASFHDSEPDMDDVKEFLGACQWFDAENGGDSDVGRACLEIYDAEAEERERKNEPRLSPGEFFAAAATFAENISEETMEKRESRRL